MKLSWHSSLRWTLSLLCLFALTAHAAGTSTSTDNALGQLEAEAKSKMTDAQLQKAQQQKVHINRDIFSKDWNKVPFDPNYFTYSDAQLKQNWTRLMYAFKLPFPSLELINYIKTNYPSAMDGVEPQLANNPAKFQEALLDATRDFFAGRFKSAYLKGRELGAYGEMISAFSETIYAYYLTDRQSVKYMMLQDVINNFDKYRDLLDAMAKDSNKKMRAIAAFAYLGMAYAYGRIAEESSIPVILARGYVGIVQDANTKLLNIYPNHPLGLALKGAINSDIMRRVGKFVGRMTYGARTTTAINAFKKSLELVPNQAITQYEFANTLIYLSHKRKINQAMRHFEKAIRTPPQYAMEALDSMYAYRRVHEIRIYALDYRSFREFDDDRRNFIEITDRNLNNVMSPNLTYDMLQHPNKYILPKLGN